MEELNALAAASPRIPMTAGGSPVRFHLPQGHAGGHYEQQVFDTGRVETRPRNLHDLFNALAWMAFPRTKAALNARHAERLVIETGERGPLRDLLTLVDEGGVLVACEAPAEIEVLVREFRWKELFWDRRAELLRDTRFVLIGHSAYEKALAPYPGITCKGLFLRASRQALAGPVAELVSSLDRQAATWLDALPDAATPKQMAPLPVFGYPGWLPDSGRPEFYAERRWFRPGHSLPRRRTDLSGQPNSV